MANVDWLLREATAVQDLTAGTRVQIEDERWRATIERIEIGATLRVFLTAAEVSRSFVLEPRTDEDGPWMGSNFSVAGQVEIMLPDGPKARIAPDRALLFRSCEPRASYAIPGGQRIRIPGIRLHRDRMLRLFDGDVPSSLANLIEPHVDASRLLPVSATRRLRALADALYAPGLNGPLRTLAIEGAVLQLLAHLAAAGGDVPIVPGHARLSAAGRIAIEQARGHLLADMRCPPSLGALAAEVGLSEKRLSAGFRTMFGMTVFETLRNERLEHARIALEAGGASLKDIAFRIGYNHVTNFTNAFTKRFGVPPTHYVRRRSTAGRRKAMMPGS